MTNNHSGRLIATSARLLTLCIIVLSGCSGGISGTGDGGPIIVVSNTDNLDSGANTGATDDTTDGTTDGIIDGSVDVDNTDATRLPQIHFAFPATLAGDQDPTNSTLSVYQPLRAQFAVVNERLLDTQVWIDLLATPLATAQSQCGDDSDCVAAQLSTGYVYTDDILTRDLGRRVASLDPQLSTAERSARESELRNQLAANLNTLVELSVGGYQSNQQISVTSNDATLDLSWRHSSDTAALRYTDNTTTLYAMHFANSSRFTFRLYDRSEALLLTAAFEPVSDGLLYEADLHQAAQGSQHYVRGFTDPLSGTLISRDPNSDTAVPLVRERYLSNGQVVSLQLCDNCDTAPNWQEQLQNPVDSNPDHALFESRFGQFEQTIADDISISNLVESVDEWLVTSGSGNAMPSDDAACSGQRVGSDLRNICWSINIDPDLVQVFQEQLQPSGALVYQRLD